jgi:transcriptional regulator with XRE-family HTH domain
MSEREICEAIGRRIRDVREHKKLTVNKLSKKSGLPPSVITNAETKGQVTLKNLVKLGVALGSNTAEGLELMFKVPMFSTMEEATEFYKNDKGTANMLDLLNTPD